MSWIKSLKSLIYVSNGQDWRFAEDKEFTTKWGSGYPGDAVTKKFLQENLNPVFGFPGIVRFSWKTASKILEEKGAKVEFEEVDPEEDEGTKKNPSVKSFFVQMPTGKEKRATRRFGGVHPYFKDRGLKPTGLF